MAIKVGEHWFSKFGSLEVNEGDEIELTYIVKEKGDRVYRNIKNLEPINHATSTTTGNAHGDKDSAIARSVALKSAVAWVHASASVDDVLDTADAFLAWLQGGQVEPALDENEQDIPF